jgi:hypothetical protein
MDPDVKVIIDGVPALARSYLELVEACDGDPGAPAAFAELAEYVSDLCGEPERFPNEITACLAAIELVALRSDDAEELVGWAFLENLCPDERLRLAPRFGPATTRVLLTLEDLDGDPGDDDHDRY